jgi:hypothetical protein
MPKANSSSSFVSAHPPIPLPDHHNHPIITRRSSSTLNEASSLPPPANAVSSNTTHTEHENDDNQNKQIISLPFNWQVKNIHTQIIYDYHQLSSYLGFKILIK